jgi:hypothetical protein
MQIIQNVPATASYKSVQKLVQEIKHIHDQSEVEKTLQEFIKWAGMGRHGRVKQKIGKPALAKLPYYAAYTAYSLHYDRCKDTHIFSKF